MALQITENCSNCDACRPVCPNEAIAVAEPALRLVCPADCIEDHPDFRETRDELLAKYSQLHA
jgi:formate hydrogenlyase subunit 6/NADH:ubiquinone oxidoreductase subunit I